MKNSLKYYYLILISIITLFNGGCDNKISVEKVELDKTKIILPVGGTETLVASVIPSNADNRSLLWKSSDPGVASVDETGVVLGISEGSAVVTVTTEEGSFRANCEVTVTAKPLMFIDPQINVILFSADGKTAYAEDKEITPTFIVHTNQESWDVAIESSWCSIEKTENSFTIVAKAHVSTTAPNNGIVTLTSGNAEPISIVVSQKPYTTLDIVPATESLFFSADGKTVTSNGNIIDPTFTVSTNQESWDVNVAENSSWCTIKKEKDKFTISVTENIDSKTKKGTIVTVTAGAATPISINVEQEGKPKEYDIYVGGYEDESGTRRVVYWKNGIKTVVATTQNRIEIMDMCIDGSDIYLAGYEKDGTYNIPVYWKNGNAYRLTTSTVPEDTSIQPPHIRNGQINAIAVDKGTVYSVGTMNQVGYNAAGKDSWIYLPKLWVNNNKDFDISNDGNSYGLNIHVDNTKIYVSGYTSNKPTYWIYDMTTEKASEVIRLSENAGQAYAIFVDGGETYVAGVDSSKAVYWKGTTKYELTSEANFNNKATDIVVFEGDTYVSGNEVVNDVLEGHYWVNEMRNSLPGVKSNSSITVGKINLATNGDVYVAGSEAYPGEFFRFARYWKNGSVVKLAEDTEYSTYAVAIVAVERE